MIESFFKSEGCSPDKQRVLTLDERQSLRMEGITFAL